MSYARVNYNADLDYIEEIHGKLLQHMKDGAISDAEYYMTAGAATAYWFVMANRIPTKDTVVPQLQQRFYAALEAREGSAFNG